MEISEEVKDLHMQNTEQESSPPPEQTALSEDGNYIATDVMVDTNIIQPTSQRIESCQPNSMQEAHIRQLREEQGSGCRSAIGNTVFYIKKKIENFYQPFNDKNNIL